MADKDVDGVVSAFAAAESLRDARVITTQLDVPRAFPAATLAARWRALVPGIDVSVVEEPPAALDAALAGYGPVVVAGSLYLVGVVRGLLVDDPLLRDTPVGGR
jgi:folylpolyglutamate synthase/dihydropteroate synthase